MGVNEGTLAVSVWPTYIGVADGINGTATEPIGHPDYQRGQIFWTPVPDERQVIGRARILCPPGEYSMFVYFQHPTARRLMGFAQMDHPVKFLEPAVLDVDPIINHELQLSARL